MSYTVIVLPEAEQDADRIYQSTFFMSVDPASSFSVPTSSEIHDRRSQTR